MQGENPPYTIYTLVRINEYSQHTTCTSISVYPLKEKARQKMHMDIDAEIMNLVSLGYEETLFKKDVDQSSSHFFIVRESDHISLFTTGGEMRYLIIEHQLDI